MVGWTTDVGWWIIRSCCVVVAWWGGGGILFGACSCPGLYCRRQVRQNLRTECDDIGLYYPCGTHHCNVHWIKSNFWNLSSIAKILWILASTVVCLLQSRPILSISSFVRVKIILFLFNSCPVNNPFLIVTVSTIVVLFLVCTIFMMNWQPTFWIRLFQKVNTVFFYAARSFINGYCTVTNMTVTK
jgi:hypothetical protein